jgi:hypothetical protein
MRIEEGELNWIQRNFRYAAVNELMPNLITAHITDVWRKESYEITAFFVIDGVSYRADAEIAYEGIDSAEGLQKAILILLGTMMNDFKENKK